MKYVAAQDLAIVMTETIRFIDKEGKQRTSTERTKWNIGTLDSIHLIDYLPANERTFTASPWAYKPATKSAIASGNYRTVTKNGTVYNLAVTKDNDAIPATYTAAQLLTRMCVGLADNAAQMLTGSDIVGYAVDFKPENNWQATASGATLAKAENRKNRHGRNDTPARKQARATARKQARATARAK